MSDYQEKLNKLKNIYSSKGNQNVINETEKALRRAIFNQALLENEVVQKIIKHSTEDIEAIDIILANDKELNEPGNELERKILFEKREWIQFHIIDRFGCKDDKAIQESIQKRIDAVVKRSKQYEKLT